MKKFMLKLKILLTNIMRIIYSFLFINVGSLFSKIVKVEAITLAEMEEKAKNFTVTCYAAGPPKPTIKEQIMEQFSGDLTNVFLLLVPVVLIILFVIYIKIKGKKDETNDNKEED